MIKKFDLGQNIYLLAKEGNVLTTYVVKGTQVIGVKQEIEFGKVATDKTIETRYKLLARPDVWLTDEVIFEEYNTAKNMADKLNNVDRAHKTAQKANSLKNG